MTLQETSIVALQGYVDASAAGALLYTSLVNRFLESEETESVNSIRPHGMSHGCRKDKTSLTGITALGNDRPQY